MRKLHKSHFAVLIAVLLMLVVALGLQSRKNKKDETLQVTRQNLKQPSIFLGEHHIPTRSREECLKQAKSTAYLEYMQFEARIKESKTIEEINSMKAEQSEFVIGLSESCDLKLPGTYRIKRKPIQKN